MQKPRLVPRRGSFRAIALTFSIFFFVASLTSLAVRAFAPAGAAPPAMVNAEAIPADIPTSGDQQLDQIIFQASEQYGIDPRLLHAVIWQESKYDPHARSGSGAQGLMQMTGATARRFNCQDAMDAQQNVVAGTKYLRWLLERFDGDVARTLAAYNAGEGVVDKYHGVPPFGQTQNYVRSIIARYGKTFHPLPAPA